MTVIMSTVNPNILVVLRYQMIDNLVSLKTYRENDPWLSVVQGGRFMILFDK